MTAHLKNHWKNIFSELSMNSMGADIADINNDGYPEIYVTDMLPEEESKGENKNQF